MWLVDTLVNGGAGVGGGRGRDYQCVVGDGADDKGDAFVGSISLARIIISIWLVNTLVNIGAGVSGGGGRYYQCVVGDGADAKGDAVVGAVCGSQANGSALMEDERLEQAVFLFSRF